MKFSKTTIGRSKLTAFDSDVSQNNLTGILPSEYTSWDRSMSALSGFSFLFLFCCSFTKRIQECGKQSNDGHPSERIRQLLESTIFADFVSDIYLFKQSSNNYLRLSHVGNNNFTGTLPSQYSLWTNMHDL